MQGPTETIMSRSCIFAFLFLSLLVLSGCGAGSSTASSPTQPAQPAFINISISPATVAPGQSATLTWSTGHATSCSASGTWSGTMAMAGSMTVMLQSPGKQTYTLICNGEVGAVSKTVTLDMSPGEGACSATAAVSRAHKRSARRLRVTGSPS
jgi:hypothetical protein